MSFAKVLGVVRIAFGVGLLAAPGPTLRSLTEPRTAGMPPMQAVWRMVAGRDIALGVALLMAPNGGTGQRALLYMCSVVDSVDGASMLAAWPSLRTGSKWGALGVAGTSAAIHCAVASIGGDGRSGEVA